MSEICPFIGWEIISGMYDLVLYQSFLGQQSFRTTEYYSDQRNEGVHPSLLVAILNDAEAILQDKKECRSE